MVNSDTREKWEKDDKRDIGERLRLSDKETWDSLKSEERGAIINKYHSLRSINHLGIDKILDDNRNLRFNFSLIFIGVLLGIFGNIFADILMQFEPKNYSIDIFILILLGFFLWRLAKRIDKLSVEHLYQEDILGYLLSEVKKDQASQE
jgi:hypothetical protein